MELFLERPRYGFSGGATYNSGFIDEHHSSWYEVFNISNQLFSAAYLCNKLISLCVSVNS